MQLAKVLDVIEGLLISGEHPDIVKVERFGGGDEPVKGGPISGVKVTFASTATAGLWGAVWPGEVALPLPDELPPIDRRASRLAIFVVRLLDKRKPAELRSWQLVALPGIGPQNEQMPSGVSLVAADGAKLLLRASATGATVGQEAETDPCPDYVIPD